MAATSRHFSSPRHLHWSRGLHSAATPGGHLDRQRPARQVLPSQEVRAQSRDPSGEAPRTHDLTLGAHWDCPGGEAPSV